MCLCAFLVSEVKHLIVEPRADEEGFAYESVQVRANADDQANTLRSQEYAHCAGDHQIERSSDPTRRQVIEQNSLGSSLDCKRQGLAFANPKRALDPDAGNRLFQAYDVQPMGQVRYRRLDFGGHRRWDENGTEYCWKQI